MLRLKSLHVRACRGIVDGPTLHFGPGGTVICGDNGTGKSSFVDAIEMVLNEQCSSLDIGAQGISWAKQGRHINHKDAAIDLILTDGNKDIPLSLDTPYDKLDGATKSFLDAARQQSFVLRRRTLLRYIDAIPSKRWEALSDFLQLSEFVAFEENLKSLLVKQDASLKRVEASIEDEEATLRQELGIAASTPVTESSALEALNVNLADAGEQPMRSIEQARQLIQDLSKRMRRFADIDAVQRVVRLRDAIANLPSTPELLCAAKAYCKSCRLLEVEEAKLKGQFYEEVLRLGSEWIKNDRLEQCPLCGNKINGEQVIASVKERLGKHRRLASLRAQVAFNQKEFSNQLTALATALRQIESAWAEATGAEFYPKWSGVTARLDSIASANSKLRNSQCVTADIASIEAMDLGRLSRALAAAIDERLAKSADLQQYERLKLAHQRTNAMVIYLESIGRESGRREAILRNVDQLRRVVDHAQNARKAAVQDVVDQVAELANVYLKRIHPEDDIANAQLVVPTRGSASLELSNTFYGAVGDPRGYYSEGHIDSMGLCLFLAIRRLHHRQRPELGILILDDVLHSVDGDHRRATAELIHEEFSDHQIIITTHDPLWFENLKSVQQDTGRGSHFRHFRIAEWNIKTGPTWGDHLSDYEWLKSSCAASAKPADNVVKAGRLLEQIMQNLCHNLSISVPFRMTGDYTIDPLWTSFYPKAMKNGELKTAAGNHIDAIQKLKCQRNWIGAHWNEWAQLLTSKEAEQFCSAVVALRDAVYCPKCRQFIRRIAELDGVWSCKGECVRYDK